MAQIPKGLGYIKSVPFFLKIGAFVSRCCYYGFHRTVEHVNIFVSVFICSAMCRVHIPIKEFQGGCQV